MKQSRQRGRMQDGAPNPIDKYVGSRIRKRRKLLGWSQSKLASMLGLTFQQVQKYERGTNRISSSRLWDFSQSLGVPPSFFFEDMPLDTATQSPRYMNGSKASHTEEQRRCDPMRTSEALDLVVAFDRLKPEAAKRIFELIKIMAKTNYVLDE